MPHFHFSIQPIFFGKFAELVLQGLTLRFLGLLTWREGEKTGVRFHSSYHRFAMLDRGFDPATRLLQKCFLRLAWVGTSSQSCWNKYCRVACCQRQRQTWRSSEDPEPCEKVSSWTHGSPFHDVSWKRLRIWADHRVTQTSCVPSQVSRKDDTAGKRPRAAQLSAGRERVGPWCRGLALWGIGP